MGTRRRLISRGEEATLALGAALGRRVAGGTVIALLGELGSGKTCFVRGLARGLGLSEGIASPTYTLMQAHEGGRLPLYHCDAWMEGREKAWLAEGGAEFLLEEGVVAIEWAGRVVEWLPEPRLELTLGHLGPEERSLVFEVVGGDAGLEELIISLDLPCGVAEWDGASPWTAPPKEGQGG